MKIIMFFLLILVILAFLIWYQTNRVDLWEVRSVDTMKYSRDLAGSKLSDPSFDEIINRQVLNISALGATHVAIGTPYDDKFSPILRKWVKAARENKLKVWFRGNFSGWEGWFGYQKIDRDTHKKLLEQFILKNPDLFEDGDIFTSCPECENGGPGDPRETHDFEGHRKFLIFEYNIAYKSFRSIGKRVEVGYFSMNFDVAKLVMDAQTTESLGNIIVIDHYTTSPEKLAEDAANLAQKTNGKIVIGELGVPIPDIHGKLSEEEQAAWLDRALEALSGENVVIGVNYWTSVGGSTALWNDDGSAKRAVEVLNKYFILKSK